jgi:hypothetical protein
MGDGLFLVGLGIVVILIGLLRTMPRLVNKDLPKSTGYLRGQEIGSYIAVGLGGVILLLGLGAILVDLVS